VTNLQAQVNNPPVQPLAPRNKQPVRLAGGWWLVLVCSERRVLLAGCGWLLVAGSFWEKSTAGWWLISRANRLIGSTDTSRPGQQVYQYVSTTWSATTPITGITAPNSSSRIRRRRRRSPPVPDPKVGCCLLTPAGGSKLSKFSQPTTHAKRFKTTSNPNTCIAKLSIYTRIYSIVIVGQSRTWYQNRLCKIHHHHANK
jgi:hypothetical protein